MIAHVIGTITNPILEQQKPRHWAVMYWPQALHVISNGQLGFAHRWSNPWTSQLPVTQPGLFG